MHHALDITVEISRCYGKGIVVLIGEVRAPGWHLITPHSLHRHLFSLPGGRVNFHCGSQPYNFRVIQRDLTLNVNTLLAQEVNKVQQVGFGIFLV